MNMNQIIAVLCIILVGSIAFAGCSTSKQAGSEPTLMATMEATIEPTTEAKEQVIETMIPEPEDTIKDLQNSTDQTGNEELSFVDEIKIIQDHTDSEPPITLAIGNKTEISLKENPSTGYSWNATVTDGLKIVNDSYIQEESKMRVGVGGLRVYELEAVSPGNQTFSAVYKRPWEQPSAEDVTYKMSVIVPI